MKVGVLQFFGWRDRSVALEDIYARAMERIAIMDQTELRRRGSPSITSAATASAPRST